MLIFILAFVLYFSETIPIFKATVVDKKKLRCKSFTTTFNCFFRNFDKPLKELYLLKTIFVTTVSSHIVTLMQMNKNKSKDDLSKVEFCLNYKLHFTCLKTHWETKKHNSSSKLKEFFQETYFSPYCIQQIKTFSPGTPCTSIDITKNKERN